MSSIVHCHCKINSVTSFLCDIFAEFLVDCLFRHRHLRLRSHLRHSVNWGRYFELRTDWPTKRLGLSASPRTQYF